MLDNLNGTLELTCTDCGLKFMVNQSEFKKLYNKQDWRGLMQNLSRVGYKIDLAYLYLGFAAEGMGLSEPSKLYFAKALELSNTEEYSCAKAKFVKCNGFDVATLATKGLP